MRFHFLSLVLLLVMAIPATAGETQYQLLRFRASWCPPCRVQRQVFRQYHVRLVAAKYDVRDRLLNIDLHEKAAKDWKVTVIPTTILVRILPDGTAKAVKRWGDGKEPLMIGAEYRRFVDPDAPFTRPSDKK